MPVHTAMTHTANSAKIKVTMVLIFKIASPTDIMTATTTKVKSAIGSPTVFFSLLLLISPPPGKIICITT